MPRKTRANRVPSTPSVSPSRVQLFRNERFREAFEKLNSKRKIWAEHSVILDEVDPTIKANLESRGWLSLLEIDHPPSTALIREFFSNLSCHVSLKKHKRVCLYLVENSRKKESVDSKLARDRVSKFYWWVAISSQAWGLVSLIV